MISYDEFKKVEIRAGKILSAEKVPDTDKLLKLAVDFAESIEIVDVAGAKVTTPKVRQIISGISLYFPDTTVLVGKTCMFVTNLEHRVIRGLESQGMILAVSTEVVVDPESKEVLKPANFSLLEPNSSIPAGTCAK